MHIETFSTAGQLPRRRIDYWNAVTSTALTDQIATPADPSTFFGRIRRAELGDICFAEITASAAVVTHSRAHISQSREAIYIVRLPLVGEVTIQQGSKEARLLPGDFALCDTARPYKLLMGRDATLLTLRIPRMKLERYIAFPDAVTAVTMAADSAEGGLTSRFLRDFWRAFDQLRAPDAAQRFGEIALQLLASSYAALPQARIVSTNLAAHHRVQIVQYIEDHLTNPGLTPSSIAANLGIARSYAHRLFSAGAESISQYILRRRLEECARAFVDPLQSSRTITSIAFGQGFNSLPHFARVFREHYGSSARDYRSRTE